MELKAKFILLIFFLSLFVSRENFAQEFDEFEMEEQMENEEEEKEKKTIDPKIGSWYLSGNGAFQDSTSLDTMLDFFNNYNPVFQKSITSSYLGNYGLAALDNDFFARNTNVDFFFFRSREPYLLVPATVQYYNTRTPYTRLDFSQSENRVVKNETRFNVFHSQNATPYWNLTLRLNFGKSKGQYVSQEARNNFVALYSSYNKENWIIHTGFIANTVKNQDNGGISNDSLIFSGAGTEFLNVNLAETKSGFNNTYFYLNGEYRFGKFVETEIDTIKEFRPVFGFLFSSEYQRNKQVFINEGDTSNTFFDNRYYDHTYTTDSIAFNKLTNVFQLKQYENSDKKTSFGKRAFVGIDFFRTSSPGPLMGDRNRISGKFYNFYIGGGIFRQIGRFWTWDFDGKIHLLGRNAGQTELSGIISKPFVFIKDSMASFNISGKINNVIADYFQEQFYSNHYKWDNNFKNMQRMEVNGSFVSPRRKLKVGGNYAIINNYLYNNYQGIPDQTEKELLVLSAYVDKDFNHRNLHLRTKVLWQNVSDPQFIHLPDLSAFVSAYYQFVVSKVLYTQLGVDTRYTTKYYADAYSPSTGLFYLQSDKKYGNYPYIDIYASLRLKRTRVFFQMLNIGTNFLDGEYFTTPNYPMPRSTFRLGLSWLFYD